MERADETSATKRNN